MCLDEGEGGARKATEREATEREATEREGRGLEAKIGRGVEGSSGRRSWPREGGDGAASVGGPMVRIAVD